MHGLDGILSSLDEPRHATQSGDEGNDEHDTLGICLFVAAVAGLGIASVGLSRRGATTPPLVKSVGAAPFRPRPLVSGRSRLAQLCVLRL
jgi:hypothetical protein